MVLAALGGYDATVWLFGSCARGGVRQHSDIDIAILPRDPLPIGFFGELDAEIEESTIPYDVDLVDLRQADPLSSMKCSGKARSGGTDLPSSRRRPGPIGGNEYRLSPV